MKLLLAVLAIGSASAADFVCDGPCAMAFYEHLAAVGFETHKLTAVDAGVYAYMVYQNFAATSGANIDVVENFMTGVSTYCQLTASWVRDDVSKCFADAECEGDSGHAAAKTGFKDCDDNNENGCSRIMGLMVHQFSGPACFKEAFPSELTEAEKIHGAKVFTVFMAVMGNWEAMGAGCQGKITTAAGYTEGDDVVLTIADNADKIIEGAKVEECGYKDGAWDTENADTALAAIAAAGKKAVADTTTAQAEVAKLEATITGTAGSATSSAAVLSAAAAAIAMLL